MKTLTVFHPESPGIKLTVQRGFLGQIFKPIDFATLSEVLFHYKNK
jgi:hypothetical protein